MVKRHSIHAGRDMVGNVIVTGDSNRVNSQVSTKLSAVTLPSAESIDISAELAHIRRILEEVKGEHTNKIRRALDDANEEARRDQPIKDEVGSALKRALDYAKAGASYADVVGKLGPVVVNSVAWLGSNWHHLLSYVNMKT